MQCACAILSYVASPALQFDFTLFHKSVLRFSLQLLLQILIILRINERNMIIIVYWISCKVHDIFVRFYGKLNFQGRFKKYSNVEFQESPSSGNPVVPCWWTDVQRDRRTEMTKLIVAFRQLSDVSKN